MDDLTITHRVASYECSADHLMKPEWFMLYCQEIAEMHAMSHGFGSDWALAQGVAWVEIVGDFEFFRRPTWKEEICLRTNTGRASALQARRFVEMTTPAGEVLARADLTWVLIDIERRRPVPFKRVQFADEMQDCPCITSAMPEIPAIPEGDAGKVHAFTAELRDVDFNGHINNSAYLTWTLGALGDAHPGEELRRIHITFRKECFAGDEMELTSHTTGMLTQHRICSGGETRAELQLVWQSGQTH